MLRILIIFLALIVQTADVRAESRPAQERAGDVYEIRLESRSETTAEGSSSSSSSFNVLQERVIAVRDDGVELEFDLPEGTSPEDRARNWQFPARVLASPGRPLELLNSSELEARLPAWLERWGFTAEACGRWIFTWNAFKIECDPATVLDTIEAFNLRLGELRDGALYSERGAREPAPLRLQSRRAGRQTLVAEMAIDPQAVRRERAASDVVVGEIMGEPIMLEAALEAWTTKEVSGTIATDLEVDREGRVIARTTVVNVVITDANGAQERGTTTTTTERRRVSP